MTRYLLDTNTFSFVAHGKSKAARAQFERLFEDKRAVLSISAINLAEIRYGMVKHPISPTRRAAIEALLGRLNLLPWDAAETDAYSLLRTRLAARSLQVTAMDLLIASQAIAAGAVLVSHDTIFQQMGDLVQIVDWATDLP